MKRGNVVRHGPLGAWAACALCTAPALAQITTLASHVEEVAGVIEPAGLFADAFSSDGRWILFVTAEALSARDSNGTTDIYARDRWNGGFELVSRAPNGAAGNDHSGECSTSADGRWIVFRSYASDLVAGDTNGEYDVFVRDRSASITERVNVDSNGAQALGMLHSGIGISDDGRYVVFASSASNLVADDTNDASDVFRRDRHSQQTVRVNVSSSGAQANGPCDSPRMSADGRFIAFNCAATNLVPMDANGYVDVLLRDMLTGAVELISVSSSGVQGDQGSGYASLSADGRFVAFTSWASNLVASDTNTVSDIFLRDRVAGSTQRVSVSNSGVQGNSFSFRSHISRDGRFVCFSSDASNLVVGDSNAKFDVFLRDRVANTIERVNLAWNGAQANGHVNGAAVSPDARYVAFATAATQMAPGVFTTSQRVYVRDRTGLSPERYCSAHANSLGCLPQIDWRGQPSASFGERFLIGARNVLPQRLSVVFLGSSGPSASPFLGGTLCVNGPLRRARPQLASDSGSAPCTGVFAVDFNRWIAEQPYPQALYGLQVWAQCWSRDPAAASGASLSDALSFAIGP